MKRRAHRLSILALWLLAGAASAQQEYHGTAILPIVVDTTSFTQRFVIDSYNSKAVTMVEARFFPGANTPQAAIGPVACNDIVITGNDGMIVPSLRSLCPDLAAGSAWGFLALRAKPSSDDTYVDLPLFAVNSRVSNPQGAGFVVDSVAAAEYGSAWTRVTGLRRSAATAEAPAFQTNCFIGAMNQYGAGAVAARRVDYKLLPALNGQVPIAPPVTYTGTVNVAPGQLVRLLDVFQAAGAPAGDYQDWMIEFMPKGSGRPGILSFCTVQDNTSFQADIRVGKPFFGAQGSYAQESVRARDTYWNADVLGRAFEIPAGAAANTHVVYFRRPDTVKCELLSGTLPAGPGLPPRLAATDGLEIRMLDATGAVVGGGSGMTSTGQVYLGDKDGSLATLEGRYRVEVESNGQNTGATRAYSLYCTSGSGDTGGLDLIRYQESVDRF